MAHKQNIQPIIDELLEKRARIEKKISEAVRELLEVDREIQELEKLKGKKTTKSTCLRL